MIDEQPVPSGCQHGVEDPEKKTLNPCLRGDDGRQSPVFLVIFTILLA